MNTKLSVISPLLIIFVLGNWSVNRLLN